MFNGSLEDGSIQTVVKPTMTWTAELLLKYYLPESILNQVHRTAVVIATFNSLLMVIQLG